MYVEQLTPIGGVKHPWPMAFFQGGGQTGTVSLIIVLSTSMALYNVWIFNTLRLRCGIVETRIQPLYASSLEYIAEARISS